MGRDKGRGRDRGRDIFRTQHALLFLLRAAGGRARATDGGGVWRAACGGGRWVAAGGARRVVRGGGRRRVAGRKWPAVAGGRLRRGRAVWGYQPAVRTQPAPAVV